MQRIWGLDQELFRAIHIGWHREWLDPFFWVISTSGLGWVQLLVVGIAYGGALVHKKGGDAVQGKAGVLFTRIALPYVAAWAVSGILSSLYLKQWVSRDRPSQLAIANPQETFFHSAFPSGHTASAFAVAMVVWLTCRTEKPLFGWVALLWACLVGFSRVYRGVHWPTDVLAGAAVGVFSGCLVMWVLSDRKRAPDPSEPS
ncbi:MAG: phosphatase PAP2 family protein [Armatimonadetes bacterium]|nr:phosphatase PAP2 family protein [Armatimonadota bacterium]